MRNQSFAEADYTQGSTTPGVSIHSGFPNPAADASLQGLDLNRLLINHSASTFMMRLKGNEWAAQGIFDTDIVLIDRALAARKNDLVVWWRGDEFAISALNQAPRNMVVWGVVTVVIHQCRSVHLAKPARS